MKMKTLTAAAAMAAAFAFSAVADDVWYEENGVTVSGTGAASVTYRSESETSAWLDITVADDASASLTSIANNSSVTLSIQKLGGGSLKIASPLALSFLVEEGTLEVPGDCWGGHSANASAYTLTVHENGTVTAYSHVPLPNVVMRGGRFVNYTEIPANEQGLRTYKCWAMKHLIKVLPSSNGTPSVISGYASHIGHVSYMPTFDIDAGAELQLDTMICNGEVGSGVTKDSGFTKVGAGTLTFLRGGSLTGTTTLKEGTLKFAAGASLGPNATLNTYAGTTIELEDGAAFETPINTSLSCTAAEYAVLTNCAIWADAWQETVAEGATVPTIVNRGTVVGSFAPTSSGNACTFTANGVNGRPSYRFNGSNQSMLFSNLAYGTSSDPQNNVMLFIAFERNSYTQYRGFFSCALSSIAASDYQSDYTLYQQDNGPASFGFYNKGASNNIGETKATDGVPSLLSFYSNGSGDKRYTRLDYLDGTYNQNNNPGAFSLAFDRMTIGSRFAANCVPNNQWDGAIGEVIVCTNYDEATYNTILSYLKRKWHSGTKGEKCGVVTVKVPQGTASVASVGGLSDGQTPTLTKTGAGELVVGSVAADGNVAVTEGALSLIPTSVVAKVDVWMDAADESTLTVENGEVVSVRNKGRAGGSFVKNLREGVSSTVSPNLPLLTSMNGHTALGFDGTRALVLDSYTNHNDDATYTVFVAARVGDGVDLGVKGSGAETSPFSLATAASNAFDYDAPVGCHIEPVADGRILFYSGVQGRVFGTTRSASMKAGSEFILAHYNHNYGARAYLQTCTNGVAADVATARASDAMRPYPAAIDVVSVGGRLGPRGTSFYYGSATSGGMWKGEVGELIVCTRQPTAEERAAILAYLRAKWFTSGGDATTPAAIAQPIVPALDRNVKVAVSGGAELKSLAATQPLASLSVTGDATFARGGSSATSAFDISGDLLLPANMTLRMLSEPAATSYSDLITWSGSLGGSGTAWSIDARRPRNWSVEAKPNAIRVRYTKPGMAICVQ